MNIRAGIQTITNARNALMSFFRSLSYHIDKRLFIRAELKRIVNFKIEGLVQDPLANQLSNDFLEKNSYFGDVALKRLKCHNLCNKILGDLTLLNNEDFENELLEFCGYNPQYWRENVKSAIDYYLETKSSISVSMALTFVRGVSVWELECSREYMLFREELRGKSNKIWKLLANIYDDRFNF